MKILVAIFLFFYSASLLAKVESSPDIFLPAAQKEFVRAYQQAPISWWNFLIFKKSETSQAEACHELNQVAGTSLLYNPCQNIPIAKNWLHDIAKEQTFSHPPPESVEKLKASLDQAIVSLSLPLEKDTLNILRQFPLARFDGVGDSLKEFFSANDNDIDVMVLPFLLPFAPNSVESETWVQEVMNKSTSPQFYWTGPHFGAQLNKQQVIADLQWVAVGGIALVILLIAFLVWTRRTLFLALVPILGLSILGAFIFVQWIWGSIHGLTLAFGCGLVGISMDYAFHGWSSPFDKKIWKTNSISFLTTLISFSLLLFFSAPLIRQISLFAICGLTLAFCFCFLVSRSFPNQSQPPLEINVPKLPRTPVWITFSILVLFALMSLNSQKLDFSLQRMDLTHKQMRQHINNRVLENEKNSLGFFLSPDTKTQKLINQWGKDQKIPVLNSQKFHSDQSTENLSLWQTWSCDHQKELTTLASHRPYQNLFSEFLSRISCENLKSLKLDHSLSSRLFEVGSSVLSIFKASNIQEVKRIEQEFPKVFFLSQLTEDFPRQLRRESLIFLVSCFLITLLLLILFFRRKSILVFIPVVGALVSIFLTTLILQKPITFISFVSLIIILGLTLDYGVFCTSFSHQKEHLNRIFGSIFLSASTSLAGFAPLAFCGHPVLSDMGTTILAGLFGALVFTYFIFPILSDIQDTHV